MQKMGGFTLLELLIVMIILGILAALSIPVYQNHATKAYKQEAFTTLQGAKESAVRYKSVKGSFSNMTLANMDFDPNAVMGGQLRHFDYTLGDVTAITFTVTAACVDTAGADKAAVVNCAPADDTILIKETGDITCNGKFL